MAANSPFDERIEFGVQTFDIQSKKWINRLNSHRVRIQFSDEVYMDIYTTYRGEIMLQTSAPVAIKPVVSNSFVIEIESPYDEDSNSV